MAERKITGAIDSVTALNNSSNGNPRYRVVIVEQGVFETEADASINYGISNSEFLNARAVEFTLTRNGRISYAAVLDN